MNVEIKEYLNRSREIQNYLLQFFEQDENTEENYQQIIDFFISYRIEEKKNELKEILNLIVKICNNHHKTPAFYNKVQKIILYFQDSIKKFYCNSDIFNIFKSNKKLLLFLFQSKLLIPDNYIANSITQKKYEKFNYCHFFYPEFRDFEKFKKYSTFYENTKDFEAKRENGENDDHICRLIREDLIADFISYTNQNIYNLHSKIKKSFFETNSYLNKNDPELIEYSAFYGSIQIFRYIFLNEFVKYTEKDSFWLYAVHGNDSEMISYFEENSINPENEDYKKSLFESIKCHHNDMTDYFLNNFIQRSKNNYDFQKEFSICLKYYNFKYFPDEINFNSIFSLICKYNYVFFLELILKSKIISNENIEKILINFFV